MQRLVRTEGRGKVLHVELLLWLQDRGRLKLHDRGRLKQEEVPGVPGRRCWNDGQLQLEGVYLLRPAAGTLATSSLATSALDATLAAASDPASIAAATLTAATTATAATANTPAIATLAAATVATANTPAIAAARRGLCHPQRWCALEL